MLQKVFAIGNSVAITIPRRFGVAQGTAIRHLPRIRNRFSYEVVEDAPRANRTKHARGLDYDKNKESYLKRVTGGIKLNMSTEKFMRIKAYCRENPYEKI